MVPTERTTDMPPSDTNSCRSIRRTSLACSKSKGSNSFVIVTSKTWYFSLRYKSWDPELHNRNSDFCNLIVRCFVYPIYFIYWKLIIHIVNNFGTFSENTGVSQFMKYWGWGNINIAHSLMGQSLHCLYSETVCVEFHVYFAHLYMHVSITCT